MKYPDPPAIGTKLYRTWGKGTEATHYHVRAIVDREGDSYWIVLRKWTGVEWRYSIESVSALAVGLYQTQRSDPVTGEPVNDDQ